MFTLTRHCAKRSSMLCAMSEAQDPLRQVLGELLPEPPGEVTKDHLIAASSVIAQRHNQTHRIMHADAQRGGALVLAMRERGMKWREIYDATGIIQRTGDRWMKLYLKEGITPRPDDELDRRWQGRP